MSLPQPHPVAAALCVAGGGAVGSLCRWGVTLLLATSGTPSRLPWATLAVNLVGCLAIGALKSVLDRASVPPLVGLALATGVLGGFTTFSTFGLEATTLARTAGVRGASLYVLLSVGGGMACCLLGLRLGALVGRAG